MVLLGEVAEEAGINSIGKMSKQTKIASFTSVTILPLRLIDADISIILSCACKPHSAQGINTISSVQGTLSMHSREGGRRIRMYTGTPAMRGTATPLRPQSCSL